MNDFFYYLDHMTVRETYAWTVIIILLIYVTLFFTGMRRRPRKKKPALRALPKRYDHRI